MLVTIGPQLGAEAGELYRRATALRWVQSFGTGTDNIKGHPDLRPDVVVSNVHGVHGPQLSEAAFAAMLSFARHLPATYRQQAAHQWQRLPCFVLEGKSVVIFGLGAIASALAPRCRAFGMRVIGVSSSVREIPDFDQVMAIEDLGQAAALADFLVLLTPYSPRTHHIIDAMIFARMREGAYLINLARGGVVDEAALLAALDQGQIAGAALDVFEREPLPGDSPFWDHPKVLVTPHGAGFHVGYPEQATKVVSDNLRRYLEGGVGALVNVV